MTAPRLHVVTAPECAKALVLRRGPTGQVASLLWDRETGEVKLGQWLKGRVYEHRSDLSPDGRHMIYFAGTGQRWWTAISRAPWLTALFFDPQDHTWHGGGAFTQEGEVFFNGRACQDVLPEGLKPASSDAFPHGTDGFHMGGLYPAMMVCRGWRHDGGEGYKARLSKKLGHGWELVLTFAISERNRSIISNKYALSHVETDRVLSHQHWEWAEPWKHGLQVAQNGALWFLPFSAGGLEEAGLIHDFRDMAFEAIKAPYEGVSW